MQGTDDVTPAMPHQRSKYLSYPIDHTSPYFAVYLRLLLSFRFIAMAVQNSAQYLVSLFGLQGKTVLITGGTRGIGAGLTVAL